MHRSLRVLALVALTAACGGTAPEPEPAAQGGNVGKQFMPTAVTTGGMQGATQARESMRFVAEAGSFDVTARVGRKTHTWTLKPEIVALRIGDVPTLEYPVGFVKLDALSLDGGDEHLDRAVTDLMLRTLGSPIQIFVDVQSVTDLKGRLNEAGSVASGALLGLLQIDDKQVDITLHVLFERRETDKLVVEVPAFDLSLVEAGLADRLPKLAKLLKASGVDPVVQVAGSLELVEFTGNQLPTFVRTPVTVNRVAEVRERLDAEIEDHEAARYQMIRQGVPEEIANSVNKTWYDAMKARRDAGKQAPPLPKRD